MAAVRIPQSLRQAELWTRLKHAEVRLANSKELAARAAQIAESDAEMVDHIKKQIEASKHHG